MRTLREIAEQIRDGSDVRTKSVTHYELYEPYFSPLRDEQLRLLELGTHRGDSIRIFASYFQNAELVSLDINDNAVDLSTCANALALVADQRNADQLRLISERHAPDGWDIIIDDASHYGSWSLLSFDALFPLMKSGGLYAVEDWHTGYWDDWPDGRRYQRFDVDVPDGQIPWRIPSHDAGMVGFVKCLMDELANRPITVRGSHITHPRRIEWMHINRSFAILKKL
jgi:hypothetical protein